VSEYCPEEKLRPFDFACYNAMSTLQRLRGYACSTLWLVSSGSARAEARGFVLGSVMVSQHFGIEDIELRHYRSTPEYLAWREAEIAAADRRGDIMIDADGEPVKR
jgi:hypothetical protein